MIPLPYIINNISKETEDTFTVGLIPKNNQNIFSFSPGQFNMLYVFGRGEVPISISGESNDNRSILHTIRAVGTITKFITNLKRKSVVGLRGPFGSGWPVDKAQNKDIVIVAGGVGLAPLRPAIYKILSERDKYNKVILLYGARTPNDMLFRNELMDWRSRFDLNVEVTVDTASKDWYGNVGVVTTLIPKAQFSANNTVSFVCGPEVMMRFTIKELLKRGLAEDKIFISMERNMKCAIGLCGHCQFGPNFICKDGPIFRYDRVSYIFSLREV